MRNKVKEFLLVNNTTKQQWKGEGGKWLGAQTSWLNMPNIRPSLICCLFTSNHIKFCASHFSLTIITSNYCHSYRVIFIISVLAFPCNFAAFFHFTLAAQICIIQCTCFRYERWSCFISPQWKQQERERDGEEGHCINLRLLVLQNCRFDWIFYFASVFVVNFETFH